MIRVWVTCFPRPIAVGQLRGARGPGGGKGATVIRGQRRLVREQEFQKGVSFHAGDLVERRLSIRRPGLCNHHTLRFLLIEQGGNHLVRVKGLGQLPACRLQNRNRFQLGG